VVQKIKAALEARKKMLLVMTLAKADMRVDGDVLRVVFAPSESAYRSQVEANRKVISEACNEVIGRPLSVSVSIGEQDGSEVSPKQKESRSKDEKDEAANHPNIKAVVDMFKGDLKVIKPEN
jgi:hypothetical protein